MKTHIVIHHSFSPRKLRTDSAERSFNTTHKNKEFPKSKSGWHIGYQHVIYDDGEVRQYREDNEVGAHTKEKEMNYKSIGICLSGNFDVEYPSDEQIASLKTLLDRLQKLYSIPDQNIHPHRFYTPSKSCWGRHLPDDIKKYIKVRIRLAKIKKSQPWKLRK